MIVDNCRRDNGIVVKLWKYYFDLFQGMWKSILSAFEKVDEVRRIVQKTV